jgi:transcriptional regulator with XRE-family HTH domain
MSDKSRKIQVAVSENEPLATGSNAPGAAEHTLEQAIGHQVRHHRKQAGLTVAELAVAAQISPGMLSKIENGQISPSLSTLQMLAAALNVPLTVLFSSFETRRDCSYVKSGEGVEFIFMLSGQVEYAHADRSYHLCTGDAILFDSAAPHGPARLIETPMTYLSVIIYPR